jgi:O-antigen ligase
MGSLVVTPAIFTAAPDRTGDQRRQVVAGLVLAALAGATYQQGGFYSAAQWYLGALLVLATAIAASLLPAGRRRPAELMTGWRLVLAPAALLAWTLLDAGRHGSIGSGARLTLLVLAVIVVIADCRVLDRSATDLLFGGLLALGAGTGLVGWYGVADHRNVLAIPGQGLWRAAGTLSYPNAAAALLALTGLIGIALRCADRPSGRFRLVGALLTAVLTGLAATLSRGGLLAFAAGLLVLLAALRANLIWKVCWAPAAGTLVALAGLVPAVPVGSHPHLAVAGVTLAAGLAIGGVPPMARPRAVRSGPVLAVLLGLFGAGGIGLLAILDHRAGAAIGHARANLSSSDRLAAWHAVWHQIALHPIAGSGPGLRQLSWRAPDGSGLRVFAYAHDEYLQLFAELGLIGLSCLVGCAISLVRLLARSRPATGNNRASWALGVAALLSTAVSMAFDFTGHFPAITLTAAVLVGCATGPAWPEQAPIELNQCSSMKGEMA